MTAWLDMRRAADWWIQSNSFIAESEHCQWLVHYCYWMQMTINLADTLIPKQLTVCTFHRVDTIQILQESRNTSNLGFSMGQSAWNKSQSSRGRCEEFLLYWCKCIAHTLLWKLDSKPLWSCWAVADPAFNEGLARWILKCTGLDVGFDNVLDVE